MFVCVCVCVCVCLCVSALICAHVVSALIYAHMYYIRTCVCVFILMLANVYAQAFTGFGGCRLCLSVFELDVFKCLVFVLA